MTELVYTFQEFKGAAEFDAIDPAASILMCIDPGNPAAPSHWTLHISFT